MFSRRFTKILVSQAVACIALLPSALFAAEELTPDSTARGRDDYLIQSSDLLRVQVFQEDDLTREVRVTQGNEIALPLIGVVNVKNLTLREAENKIRELYERDFLVKPQINVGVIEYAKRTVNVLGSVNNPGAILFPQEEGLTLLDAIARAGGFNRFADRKKIKLSRVDSDGRNETVIINADELMESGTNDSWPLQRDDVVFIPERIF
jgi:protein involved in polysaccharide export with SLBB domain